MKDWVALGGGNSGCCGNSIHTYGFHREASSVPVSDYSRRHDPGKPYDMSWGCAGDFHHGYDSKLMGMHATVLRRLMNGELPMIAEMITKPWKDKPVYYWARWNGNKTLQRYTGKGHDHWSHISWWRSKANVRAHLWTPDSGGSGGGGAVTPLVATTAPKYPGYLLKQSSKADANVRTWQSQAKTRGASISTDGKFGPQTLAVVKSFQRANAMGQDGVIGPATWSGIFDKNKKVT